jgi:hypothetical protein
LLKITRYDNVVDGDRGGAGLKWVGFGGELVIKKNGWLIYNN